MIRSIFFATARNGGAPRKQSADFFQAFALLHSDFAKGLTRRACAADMVRSALSLCVMRARNARLIDISSTNRIDKRAPRDDARFSLHPGDRAETDQGGRAR
jgi:hypothetical protein